MPTRYVALQENIVADYEGTLDASKASRIDSIVAIVDRRKKNPRKDEA